MKIRSVLAALLGTAALTAAVGVASPAAAAPAQSSAPLSAAPVTKTVQLASGGWATLSIRYAYTSGSYKYYTATVYGQAYLSSTRPNNIYFELWGDDSFFDDYVDTSAVFSTNADGTFYGQHTTTGALLNEDWGQDEIYARVYSWSATGANAGFNSNVVTGNY